MGEGYETRAEVAAAVHKAYGPDRPGDAHLLVGGIGYPAGIHQPAQRGARLPVGVVPAAVCQRLTCGL